MDFQTERKIEVNRWIIKSRWFYMFGILGIGVLTKTLSNSNVHFSMREMVSIVLVFIVLNLTFYWLLRRILKQKKLGRIIRPFSLKFLCCFQMAVELITFTYVMHKAGGVESISSVFFFLPIVSASLLSGLSGSIAVALISGLLVNALVIGEYLNVIPHISRYGTDTLEFSSLPIALTKTVTTSIFYLVIGIFSGFGAKLLFQREKMLQDQAIKLDQESGLRNEELKKLDDTAKLLTARDQQLSTTNAELDEKIKELENSKVSLIKAFNEIRESKVKSEEEKNKSIAVILNFTDPIIVLDKRNKINLFNAAARFALGLKNKDIGREINVKEDFGLANFKDVIRKKFRFKMVNTEKGNELLTEELYINEDEEETVYKVITVDIKNSEGNYTGFMKIFYDLTREKIIDKMKSDFISIAAHQLRTPLSTIKWSTGMLLNGDLGALNMEQKNFLQKSYTCNEAMINLVNDLLNVSRIEEGRFGYNFKDASVWKILSEVLQGSKQQIEKNGIRINFDSEDKQIPICVDKQKMILVFQNILDNAIKYTPHRGTIDIEVTQSEDNYLNISVKDSGIGIPREEQKKLFSKFFRASNVVLMETEGTGLGLFIVKNIIEKHGGKVAVESEENKGTKVTVRLPVECKL